MVQMKVTASVLLAAAAIAPVVANGFEAEDSLVTYVVSLHTTFPFTDTHFRCSREDNEFESSFARDFDLVL